MRTHCRQENFRTIQHPFFYSKNKDTIMRFIASSALCCLLVLGGLASTASRATAEIADFDDLAPAIPYTGSGGGAYWNGEDGSGGFFGGGVHFLNSYDSSYGSWNGWSYSNTRDVTTAGFANQYSAFTGDAYSGANYGVYFASRMSTPTITASVAGTFEGMYVTNTTYAALSMRKGDSFAKKFGGADGTDPDWFLLTITGKDATGTATGTVEFYLADYQFENAKDDYIISNWTFVDLRVLGDHVKGLELALSSSDIGDWGMNTPAYFAMDSLMFVPEPSTLVLLVLAGVAGTLRRCWRRSGLGKTAPSE
jgi:hypothetical protein